MDSTCGQFSPPRTVRVDSTLSTVTSGRRLRYGRKSPPLSLRRARSTVVAFLSPNCHHHINNHTPISSSHTSAPITFPTPQSYSQTSLSSPNLNSTPTPKNCACGYPPLRSVQVITSLEKCYNKTSVGGISTKSHLSLQIQVVSHQG